MEGAGSHVLFLKSRILESSGWVSSGVVALLPLPHPFALHLAGVGSSTGRGRRRRGSQGTMVSVRGAMKLEGSSVEPVGTGCAGVS